jgi:ATP-dependent Clp protease ATP-binding subunit ClpC
VVVLAQDEARTLRHNYIGTEHILLGLLREEEGLAARILESLDITVEEVRAQVARIVGQGDEVTTGQIPFTPRAKKVLELSLREALYLKHNYIGTEHILLGLVRENEGVGARILLDFDADAETIRNEVIGMLSGQRRELASPYEPKSPPVAPELAAELERLRTEKENAIESQEFELAASLRERERVLTGAARKLERVWEGRPEPVVVHEPAVVSQSTWPRVGRRFSRGRMPRRVADYGKPESPSRLIATGWALFGIAFGLGLLLGWLIWA